MNVCSENDSRRPDKPACDSFKMGAKFSDDGNFQSSKISLDSEDLDEDRLFIVAGLLNGKVLPNERVSCIENCPNWSLSSNGSVIWNDISFEGMMPVTPYENGVFDPSEKAQFRVRMGVSYGTPSVGGYATQEYWLIDYSPDCPELYSYKGIQDIFKSGFKTDKLPKTHVAGAMKFEFAPTCPSDGKAVSLKRLAKAMKVDHFNWWQSLKSESATTYAVSAETAAAIKGGTYRYIKDIPPSLLSKQTDYVRDPGLNGSTYVLVANYPVLESSGSLLENDGSDGFPYYLDEGLEVASRTSRFSLSFLDAPCFEDGWYTTFQQAPLKLITRVAAVKPDGTFKLWTINGHSWTSTKSAPPGKCKDDLGKNLFPEADYDQWPGYNTYEGIISLDLTLVPPLVGKDPNSDAVRNDLADSGFSIKVIETRASATVPAGLVISQEPDEWEEVQTAGEIEIVLSAGNYGSCGDISHGGQTTRVRYKTATVPFGSNCETVKEVQTGTCNDGVLTFDGIAQSETCSVLPQPPAECTQNIKKICKAGLFQSLDCELPSNVISIKKDPTYVGSLCHEAPEYSSFLNFILKSNSYTIKGDKLQVNFGCNARFNITYKTSCFN